MKPLDLGFHFCYKVSLKICLPSSLYASQATQRDDTTEESFQFEICKLSVCLCIYNTSLHLCLYSFVTLICNMDLSITITRSKQVNVF